MPPCANPTLWRTNDYTMIPYLYIDRPPIIFAGQVNQASLSYPLPEFTYDNVTVGAYTDVWQHQTIIFGSAPGLDDLGRARVRVVPSSSKMYISRCSVGTSDGTCSIVDNSYWAVLDQFRPFPRIPYISDGVTSVDGTVYPATTQLRDWSLDYTVGINGRPQPNLGYGPAFAGNVDPNTNLLTVTFPGVSTYSKGYDANIVSWSVNYGDGTIVSGSNPNYTFTFPVGRRHVYFTATDSNGNTKTRHVLIIACKKGTTYEAIEEFDVLPRTLSLNKNTFSVRVRQAIPRSTYPDMMNVIYWKEEYYNGTKGPLNVIGSAGATGCETVKFSGWHYTDDNSTTAQPTGYLNEVTLNCLDVGGWLDVMPGFSIEINRMASPTSWYQQKNANIDKFIMEALFEYQSTVRDLTDIYDSNTGDEYGISRLGCGQQTFYSTCQEFMDRAIGYEFSVNAQGMIFMRPDQCLLTAANRTSVSILTVTETDILNFKFLFQRFPRQHWNRGAFVIASTTDITNITTPATSFWVAPGQAPGIGAAAADYNEQLANNAVEAMQRTARRYSEDNADYGDFECELIWPGDAGIDPAYGQWLTFNVSATYAAQRGIPLNARARIMSVTITDTAAQTGNSSVCKVIGRFETDSPLDAATDDTPPASNVATPPPTAPPPALIVTSTPYTRHDGTSVVGITLNKVFLGSYYTSGSGAKYTPGPMAGLTGTLLELRLDPFAAFLGLAQTGALPAYLLTTTGLWYILDILNPSSSWSHQLAFSTVYNGSGLPAPNGGYIRPSSSLSGEVGLGYYDDGADISYAKWTDTHGSNILFSQSDSTHPGNTAAIDIDQYGSREILWGVRLGSGSPSPSSIYRVLISGKTVLNSTAVALYNFIQKPLLTFSGGQNSSISTGECFIWSPQQDPIYFGGLFKTSDSGATAVNITPAGVGGPGGIWIRPFSPSSLIFTTNSNVITCPFAVGTDNKIYRTTTGGASWLAGTTDSGNLANVTLGYYPKIIVGSYAIYTGGTNGMGYSPDQGQTLIDCTGNFVAAVGAISGGFKSVIPLY